MKIIIILGDKHYLRGNILKKRLLKSLLLSNTKKIDYIITTGGNTTRRKNHHTEAYVMKQWLVNNNIPRNKIILENKSQNTIENAKYSKRITDLMKRPEITVVTSKSHTPRAKRIFKEIYGKNIKFVSS